VSNAFDEPFVETEDERVAEKRMRQYSMLSALWRAPLFSRGLYQDVALRWRGIGMRYLMLLLAITWLVPMVKFTVAFTNYINTDARSDLADFPPMTLTAGHVSSPVKQPFVYRVNGHPLFVLDTTGEVKRPSEKGAQMLITETSVVQEDGGTTRATPLAGFPNTSLDSSSCLGWLQLFRNLVLPVLLPLAWAFSLAYRLVCALVYAAIGLAFAAAFGTRISYPALLRLAVVAMTPILLIDTVLWLSPLDVGCLTFLIYPLITLGYLAYGVKVTADLTRDAPPAFPLDAAMQSPPRPPRDPLVPPETDRLFP
jgi:hypothetical protein